MDETTRLFPREIAVLRAVQGSFRQLRESRRPVDALVLQIGSRLDDIGDRAPGYWQVEGGRRVRAWLMCPSGLPAYPRIRARASSTSPPRYITGVAVGAGAAAGQKPAGAAALPTFSASRSRPRPAARPPSPPDMVFPAPHPIASPPPAKKASGRHVTRHMHQQFAHHKPREAGLPDTAAPGADTPAQGSAPLLHSDLLADFDDAVRLGTSAFDLGGAAGAADPGECDDAARPSDDTPPPFGRQGRARQGVGGGAAPTPTRREALSFDDAAALDSPGGIGSPSSVVAASWKLYDEALRRFALACDESDHLVGVSSASSAHDSEQHGAPAEHRGGVHGVHDSHLGGLGGDFAPPGQGQAAASVRSVSASAMLAARDLSPVRHTRLSPPPPAAAGLLHAASVRPAPVPPPYSL